MDLIHHLLFENPLALWILLGLGAVVAGIVWSRTGSRRAVAVAVTLAALAVVVGLVAWLVETDREKLIRTIDRMAAAADSGDAEAFIEYLSPDYGNGPRGKDTLAGIVRLGFKMVRVKAESPIIQMDNGEATVTQVYNFRAAPGTRATLTADRSVIKWQGTFRPDADGQWRLRSAMCISPVRMSPEEAARYLPRMP